MVEPESIRLARERRLGTKGSSKTRVQDLQRNLSLKRDKQSREAMQRKAKATKEVLSNKIQKLKDDITFTKLQLDKAARGELKGKRYKGSRARKVWNNRITGQQAEINFLLDNIDKGFINSAEILKVSNEIRRGTTKNLERKRQRAGTPGSSIGGRITKATTGVQILSGQISKDFTRVQTAAEAKRRATKIRAISAEIAKEQGQKEINNAFSNSGLGIINEAFTPKQRKQIFTSLTTQSTLSQGQTQKNLKDIDKNVRLNDIQKEEAKRVILGIGRTAKDFLIAPNERLRKVLANNLKIPTSTQERIVSGQSLTSGDIQKLRTINLSNPSKTAVRAALLQTAKNAPKNVAEGLAEVAYEITIGAAIGIFNASKYWGSTLGTAVREKRYNDFLIGIGTGPIGYVLTRPKTKEIIQFVIKNPKDSAAIFGLALAAGMVAAESSFSDNPIKATTKAIAFLSPRKVFGSILKPIKATVKGLGKIAFSTDELSKVSKELVKIKKLKSLKSLSNTEKKLITTEIKQLEQRLALLKEANKIKRKLNNFLTPKTNIDDILKGKKVLTVKDLKKTTPSTIKQLSEFEKAIIELERKNRKVSKARKVIRQSLSDKRKAELLKDFTKIKKLEVTIVKKLPSDKAKLEKLLIEARKSSGQTFSRLKKKIKKDFGFNVIERKKDGKIIYKLLEPKEQRKLGIKTAAKKELIIDIEKKQLIKKRISKKTIKNIEDIAEPKKSLKQLDREFRQIEQDVIRMKRSGLLSSRKAQTNLIGSVRRSYTKTKKNISKIKTEIKEFKQSYIRDVKKLRNVNTKRLKQGKAPIKESRTKISNRQKRLSELKKRLAQEEKKDKGLIKLLLLFIRTEIITRAAVVNLNKVIQDLLKDIDQATDTINDLTKQIKNINKQITPTKPKPGKPGKPRPRRATTITTTKTIRTPQPMPSPKITKGKGIVRDITKKPLPKIKFSLPSLPKKGARNAYQAVFYLRGKPIAQTSQLLPLNRTHNLSRKRILSRKNFDAYRIKEIGKTSIVDVSQRQYNKDFSIKKSFYVAKSTKTKKASTQIKKSKTKTIKRVKKSSRNGSKKKKGNTRR